MEKNTKTKKREVEKTNKIKTSWIISISIAVAIVSVVALLAITNINTNFNTQTEEDDNLNPGSSLGQEDPVCGNNVQESDEECDDGNTETETCNYGTEDCLVCNSECQLVPGETSMCGDNDVDPSHEDCDDGNTITEMCLYGLSECTVCNDNCQLVPGATSYCGDGVLNEGEGCDDGNTLSGDGCSNTCNIETIEPECGNGIVETGEMCDNIGSEVSCLVGGSFGTQSCLSDCTYSECELGPFCGNGVLEPGEQCDSIGTEESCLLNGFEGTRNCLNSCLYSTCTIESQCGNGIIEGLEQCDDGNTANSDGCSYSCTQELDWICTGEPSNCVEDESEEPPNNPNGDINVELIPEQTSYNVGDQVRIQLIYKADEYVEYCCGTISLDYNPSKLRLIKADHAGSEPRTGAWWPSESDGWTLNEADPAQSTSGIYLAPQDGKALYIVLGTLGSDQYATPEGVLITTFVFEALSSGSTQVDLDYEGPANEDRTIVWGGIIGMTNTGSLTGSTVSIN